MSEEYKNYKVTTRTGHIFMPIPCVICSRTIEIGQEYYNKRGKEAHCSCAMGEAPPPAVKQVLVKDTDGKCRCGSLETENHKLRVKCGRMAQQLDRVQQDHQQLKLLYDEQQEIIAAYIKHNESNNDKKDHGAM